MSIKESHNNKRVTFDTQGGLEDKIDRLTVMMSQLVTKDDGTNKQFKPQIYQSKRRGQSRNFYDKCNYDQRNYQNRYRSNSRDRRIQFSGRIHYEQNYRGRPRYGQGFIGMTLGEEILEVMQEHIKVRILEDRTIEEDIEEIIGMRTMTEKEIGVGLEKDHIQTIVEGETGVVVIVDQGQDQGQVQIGIELDALSVGNMITLQKIAPPPEKKER